ncbi:MAG: hypothetical protein NTY68_05570 [Candidatus Micrarchaeota archaeon]|nr:hypothetical protein [Candidatus Micrarchaeota archaeon]
MAYERGFADFRVLWQQASIEGKSSQQQQISFEQYLSNNHYNKESKQLRDASGNPINVDVYNKEGNLKIGVATYGNSRKLVFFGKNADNIQNFSKIQSEGIGIDVSGKEREIYWKAFILTYEVLQQKNISPIEARKKEEPSSAKVKGAAPVIQKSAFIPSRIQSIIIQQNTSAEENIALDTVNREDFQNVTVNDLVNKINESAKDPRVKKLFEEAFKGLEQGTSATAGDLKQFTKDTYAVFQNFMEEANKAMDAMANAIKTTFTPGPTRWNFDAKKAARGMKGLKEESD